MIPAVQNTECSDPSWSERLCGTLKQLQVKGDLGMLHRLTGIAAAYGKVCLVIET